MAEQAAPLNIAKHEVRDLFPTTVIVAELEEASSLNAALREAILARKAVAKGVNRSNVLGWHSDSDMLAWGGDSARRLALTMMQLCGKYTQDVGVQNNRARFQMGLDMWANVSPPGASNQYHCHAGCLWSGVYYVDDGGDPGRVRSSCSIPAFP